MEIVLSNLLKRLGFSVSLNGYAYSKEAIYLVIENPHMQYHITTMVYPIIAQNNGVSSSSVEKSIRWSIEKAWVKGDYELINNIFWHSIDPERGKPTNAQFILTMAEYIDHYNKN